ncbi:trans-aconitate 2-methyltransferase [Halovivax sp.]|uniref:class I SAM-dependent methyltransferase n=1 Tax=Halovivax sp. TaxID=1935978 RepID=UPI0025BF4C70|nr:class I SAM-dependent methyltransferase [Halovivax sp.]
MTDATHPDTIDWNRFWTDADEDDRTGATPSAAHAVDLLADFFGAKGVPDSIADVGCGPGALVFELANGYPETTVIGYDAADPVLAENRDRAHEEGVGNVRFERAVLPEFDPGRTFDLVFCFATLCYVADSETALSNLYDAVAPDGHLVVSYINDFGRAHYRRALGDDTDRTLGPGYDPDRFAERFRLTLEGESTLSYRKIHDALGTWPRSFWEVVDKPEEPWAWRQVPLVWVPK